MLDAIVIGGGFAGVTAARELTLAGLDCTLIEARDRLGGRTWYRDWGGDDIEFGGGWVHWHQPHAWAELTRAGQGIGKSDQPEVASWAVAGERRSGPMEVRHEIAVRAWNRFVAPAHEVLPRPHDPLFAQAALAPIDAQTIAQRLDEIGLDEEERAVIGAELEALAHGFLDDAGAVSALRWHALSGYSLELTQETGGVYTFGAGTRGLIDAMAGQAAFPQWLSTPVESIGRVGGGVEVRTRNGDVLHARTCVLTVPLNVLPHIRFDDLSKAKRGAIALGQASRGIKLWLRVRGAPRGVNAIAEGHPFGYLMTDRFLPDGSQLLIGFGRDAAAIDADDREAVQRALDELAPGLEIIDVTTHDWLADEFARGTWAIHRPGWFTHHHAAMRAPESGLVFAGSDLADGWSGFVDGAIESGLRASHQVQALLRP
ncbi:MAG: pseudooxynicotine oxidase [Gaiellales bacterium]|nr:pseudooxynicotine oxidase [Gaiellales bacterium]